MSLRRADLRLPQVEDLRRIVFPCRRLVLPPQLSPDELRVELNALLSDALLNYATSGRLPRERSSQEKSLESETASLELRSKPVLSVNRPEAGDVRL